jgi:outer membrane protein OmpA-like peptidoglycan-associated protein
MLKRIFICALFSLVSFNALAYDLSGKFGIGLNGSYQIPVFGNNFNDGADADFGYGLHARYHLSDALHFELALARSEFDDTRTRFDNLNVWGVYRLDGKANFTPVVGLGLGAVRPKNYNPTSTKLSALVRLGAEYGINESLSLGLFADYQYVSKLLGDMPRSRAHVVSPHLAITWYFGAESTKSVVSEVKKEVAAKVEAKKEEVKSNFVDESNLDSDDDGVKDPNDRCPQTAKGTKVNSIGCALDEKASIQINVEFLSGKSNVQSKYDAHLTEVADFFKKNSEIKAQIQGYTDNTGSEAKNIALSEARAKAVMNELIKKGVDKSRLSAKGFGPANPIADNSTLEGRQQNRRVVAELSSK